MPRRVDHHTKHTAIAEAVWRCAARGGIETVTLRNVAAEATMSLGQLQHYVTNKDDLLTLAHHTLTERATHRANTHHPTDEDPEPRTIIRDTLTELLPLDQQRTLETHARLAYLAKAATDPTAAAHLHKTHTDRETLITNQLRRGQRHGTVPIHLDPTHTARTLLAVLDGLTIHVLIGHHTPADAEHALDTHLDTLFTD